MAKNNKEFFYWLRYKNEQKNKKYNIKYDEEIKESLLLEWSKLAGRSPKYSSKKSRFSHGNLDFV